MNGDLPGGVPPRPDEQRAEDQDAQLRTIIQDAFRLIPPGTGDIAGTGSGQGEGVSPSTVDAIARSLMDLRTATGGDRVGILDWLSTGLATAAPGDPGDTSTAAMRIRDFLMETAIGLDDGQPDRRTESDAELDAADAFATGVVAIAQGGSE